MSYQSRLFFLTLLLYLACCAPALGQTTAFTYQGKLTDGGTPANGNYDLQFALWDSVVNGAQVGSTQTLSTVAVSNGVFTVSLDFGANAFTGATRFLEIGARPSGGGSFTLLSPRQQITSTPYAIRTLSATAADGLSSACANCVQDSQINSVAGSKVNGAIPVASIPSSSTNYIQNTSSQQTASNFNISGNGTVAGTLSGSIVNATGAYTFNGQRALYIFGSGESVAVGGNSGTLGILNAFFGWRAGLHNTAGNNAFFGADAGIFNTTGSGNAFFGGGVGTNNTSGFDNSFFGRDTGDQNVDGFGNAFFGATAGGENTSGSENVAIGPGAGLSNTIENLNTFVGAGANGASSISNATALGAFASVTRSNSLVLGSIAGVNQANSDTNVGIGTTAPNTRLDVVGNAFIRGSGTFANNPGVADLQVGYGLASDGGTGSVARLALQPFGHTGGPWKFIARDDATKAYLDWVYGPASTGITQDSNGNVGIGEPSPTFRLQVFNPGTNGLRVATNTGGGTLASFGGFGTFQIDANGIGAGRFVVQEGGNVGIGTPAPDMKLSVNGNADKPGGGSWAIFSDERLKNIKGNFMPGLNAVMQLRPLRYEYKQDNALGIKSEGEHVGFSAQQVQRIIPEAVSKDDKGYLLVNNDPILWTMLNAIKEQQVQIEELRIEVRKLRASSHRRTNWRPRT